MSPEYKGLNWTGDYMDVRKIAFKAAVVGLSFNLMLPGSAVAKDRQTLMWDSGFESFCDAPCVSAYRTKKSVILYFIDPAKSSTTFIREIALPKDATITRPKLVSSVDALGFDDDHSQWLSATTSGTIPPPPPSGSGVITAQASIYDGRGSLSGIAIIRYYYVNGLLVNVTVEYISLDQGSVE